jgi:hypothetical protein
MTGEADSLRAARERMGASTAPNPQAADIDAIRVPYKLPGAALYPKQYPGVAGSVLISPTRGAHDEALGGVSPDDHAGKVAMLRQVTSQRVDTQGIPWDELYFHDWIALMFHFLALSAGDDTLNLTPVHKLCGKASPQTKRLTQLRCVHVRAAEIGESPNWPPLASGKELDKTLDAIRAMETDKADDEGEIFTRVIAPADLNEPFTSKPLKMGPGLPKSQVTWRYLRLRDLDKAQEFVAQFKNTDVNPDGMLHTYLLALQIVAIDGKAVSPLQAATWVKRQYSFTLNDLRAQIVARDFGYDLAPKFKCPAPPQGCGVEYRVTLPIDAAFRSEDVDG